MKGTKMGYKNSMLIAAVVSLIASLGFYSPTLAQKQTNVEIGVLACNVEGGVGYIFGSKKNMICTFKHATDDRVVRYSGSITKYGLDVGYTVKSSIIWAVFAPTNQVKDGDLAGNYAGVSAEATAGLGIGANVLLGGLKDSIALQPLSIQGQTGVNVAAGVTGLKLRLANQQVFPVYEQRAD